MAHWQLSSEATHLNHGSFGATPIEVLALQGELRSHMESNPVEFMLRHYQPLLEGSRSALANFVRADPAGLVFVPNATYGVNSVLRSLEDSLPAGCEIVVTTHTYNACRNAAAETARRVGAKLVVADIPFPITGPAQAAEAVLGAVSPKTRLVILDHVTSATGIILPVAEITADLEPDVTVLIDGAHAPGMVDLDIAAIGASFYTANCHKWICAPKGSAFLWVDDFYRDRTVAAAISHGYNDGWAGSSSRFHSQFDWTGTDDPTARLCVEAALYTLDRHRPGGWPAVRRSNHELVLRGRQVVANALGCELPTPDGMIGSIASLPVPPLPEPSVSIFDPLTEVLQRNWSIEVPVFAWPESPQRLLRISAQQYNTMEDYYYLAEALAEELG